MIFTEPEPESGIRADLWVMNRLAKGPAFAAVQAWLQVRPLQRVQPSHNFFGSSWHTNTLILISSIIMSANSKTLSLVIIISMSIMSICAMHSGILIFCGIHTNMFHVLCDPHPYLLLCTIYSICFMFCSVLLYSEQYVFCTIYSIPYKRNSRSW